MQYEKDGKPLPKFGEWDVNDPASTEEFTVIFNKARDEKKTGGGRSSALDHSEEIIFTKMMINPATLYFIAIATTVALVGQHLVRKAIAILGITLVVIFILTLTLSVSVVLLDGWLCATLTTLTVFDGWLNLVHTEHARGIARHKV
ncbi:hypothetical protein JHK87_016134 [Glycine soja]|nr:hypothetical protein JHK87_016134 [Glycine soja]